MADEHQDGSASMVGVAAYGSPARSPGDIALFRVARGPTGSAAPNPAPLGPNGPTGPTFLPDGFTEAQEPDLIYPPTVALQTTVGMQVEATVTRDETDATVIRAVGRTASTNRDAILIQSASIHLLLKSAIERARATGSNSTDVPALEAILAALDDLHKLLMATTAPAEIAVGARAISFRDGLVNWWDHDHVSILDRSFNMGLFAGGLMLCSHFGLVSAVTVATLIRGKEIGEALKEAAKILPRRGSKDALE